MTPSGAVVTTSGLMPDIIRVNREREKGPPPESEWNPYGIWRKVATEPPIYIAKGYPESSPRTDREGEWLVDPRDGKRLFGADRKVGSYSPGILCIDAGKIVNWQYFYPKFPGRR